MNENAWTARRIFTELCDRPRREAIAVTFWQDADQQSRAVALAELSKAMSFRPESLRKATLEKKASLLLSRLQSPRFTEVFETALMLYHLRHARPLMGACLDHWGITHEDGIVEGDDHKPPTPETAASAAAAVRATYPLADLALYFATVGLLMDDQEEGWRGATWPVADGLAGELAPAGDAPIAP